MAFHGCRLRGAIIAVFSVLAFVVQAADYPAPKEADWIAHEFRFHTGEVMPALRLHYTTVGNPAGAPVLILHGTTGSGTGMLNPAFADMLFGPGQPLDASRTFIILPDAIGAGKSAKPSDGLRAAFPHYDYADVVLAQYRLVTEGLGLHHLRLVLGNSAGGMNTWLWGVTYPGFVDALVPMASQPSAMAGRNWMMRRMLIESIRNDPAYQGGNYTTQPPSLRLANLLFTIGTNGGTLGWQARAPTTALANKLIDDMLAAPPHGDANDFLWQEDASRDYDPSAGLERINAAVLAINSEDDERNPPQTGIMQHAIQRIHNARLYVIPASAETRGHDTTGMAKFWRDQLGSFLGKVENASDRN